MEESHDDKSSAHRRLHELRREQNWTQEELAVMVGTTKVTISRWENGSVVPSPYFREKLREVFNKESDEELGFLQKSQQANSEQKKISQAKPLPIIWNVPYQRNPLFTGRDDTLVRLRTMFTSKIGVTQPLAISGLGGIGKTQIVIEYAYRYRDSYDAVFWARADTYDTLASDFLSIGRLLNLPEQREQEQEPVIKAVLAWFDNTYNQKKWLLILDNADEMEMVRNFIPSAGSGHVLLTTRVQAVGVLLQRIELEGMSLDECTRFLLQRAKLSKSNSSLEKVSETMLRQARAIAEEMACLPLALDQAGAYIEETQCSMDDYLLRYKAQHSKLLSRRGNDSVGHPYPVSTTWSLSFEKIEQSRPAAAKLLRLCAFLYPDAIAEAMFVKGAPELDSVLQAGIEDPLELDENIGELLRFSLVQRFTEAETKVLIIHRLVQVVLRNGLSQEEQREWSISVIRMINRAFPEVIVSSLAECQQILPHAQLCAELIKQWNLLLPESAQVLQKTGRYLQERGQYSEAESFLRQALEIRERVQGEMHHDTAQNLNDLGALLRNDGKYEQAELLLLQAISIRQQVPGLNPADLAQSLNDLAALYWYQGKYAQSETLHGEALVLRRRVLEPGHSKIADSLGNIGLLHYEQGRYERALPFQLEALAIREKALGPDHPSTAISLNNLGCLCWRQQKYEQADAVHKRALAIWEHGLGPGHPNVATSLCNRGLLYISQKKYIEAEELLQRSLVIRQQRLKADHSHIAYSLNGLARIAYERGIYQQAETLYQQALKIREKNPSHPDLGETLSDMAQLYSAQGKYKQAERFFERALDSKRKGLGLTHPITLQAEKDYVDLLRISGREKEQTLD